MASLPFQSSHVELWGKPEITKPEPLRIVKERSNTIAGCGASRAVPMSRSGSAGHRNASGSSPEGPNKPLTIFKRRRGRGSILGGSLEWDSRGSPISSRANEAAKLHNLSQENDDVSLKARQSSARTASVGSFLKSELFRGSSESGTDISCSQSVKLFSRNRKETFNPMNRELFPSFNLGDLELNQELSFAPSQRRKSMGKKLISKAFDGLGNARSKSLHFLRSKSSKDSLLPQVSLRNKEPSRQIASEMSSRNSSRFSFEQESVFTHDPGSNSFMCPDEVALLPSRSCILYPDITVIPEIDTADFGSEVSLWVAVVLTGVLRKAADYDTIPDMLLASQTSIRSRGKTAPDSTSHGYLYDLDVTLTARKGCVLESVIAEKDQPRRLHLGQTELTLAKVKLLVSRGSISHVRESSKELIAELESRLGNATTEYLTIGISYKHSAFPTSRSSTAVIKGLSYHTTTTRIEAHAVIKRHCSKSLWSRQTNLVYGSSGMPNPVFSWITAHYSPAEAARLICKITPGPLSLPEIYQLDLDTGRRWNSSSDTIIPIRRDTSGDIRRETVQLENSISIPASKQSLDITQAGFHDTDCSLGTLTLNPCSDPDPARKIWLEMRKTSRGTVKRAPHAIESLVLDVNGRTSGKDEAEMNVRMEQARIMELALRNKRSVGADTLRSMATPSMSMGLGMGRGWGWGPPWW